MDPVDLYVKQRVVKDAINIALIKSDDREVWVEELNSLSLILPNQDEQVVFETCMLMMRLWFTLNTSVKTPDTISTFDFEKLASYHFVKGELGLKKADLSLTFQYVT